MEGEGVGGGVPLPHQGVFAFLGFKISDLVHTLGEFLFCIVYRIPQVRQSVLWKLWRKYMITDCIYSLILLKNKIAFTCFLEEDALRHIIRRARNMRSVGGLSPSHTRSFCNFRVQNKQSGAFFGWIFEVLSIPKFDSRYRWSISMQGCCWVLKRLRRLVIEADSYHLQSGPEMPVNTGSWLTRTVAEFRYRCWWSGPTVAVNCCSQGRCCLSPVGTDSFGPTFFPSTVSRYQQLMM